MLEKRMQRIPLQSITLLGTLFSWSFPNINVLIIDVKNKMKSIKASKYHAVGNTFFFIMCFCSVYVCENVWWELVLENSNKYLKQNPRQQIPIMKLFQRTSETKFQISILARFLFGKNCELNLLKKYIKNIP